MPSMEQFKEKIREFEKRRGKEVSQDELVMILRKLSPDLAESQISCLFPGGFKGLDGFIDEVNKEAFKIVEAPPEPSLKEKQQTQLASLMKQAETIANEPKNALMKLWSGVVSEHIRHIKLGLNIVPRSKRKVTEAKMGIKVAASTSMVKSCFGELKLIAKSKEQAVKVVELIQQFIFKEMHMNEALGPESETPLIVSNQGDKEVVLTVNLPKKGGWEIDEDSPVLMILKVLLQSMRKLEFKLAFGLTFDEVLANPDKIFVDFREALQLFFSLEAIPKKAQASSNMWSSFLQGGEADQKGNQAAAAGSAIAALLNFFAAFVAVNVEYDETKVWPLLDALGLDEFLETLEVDWKDVRCAAGVQGEVRKRWNDPEFWNSQFSDDEEQKANFTRKAKLVKSISDCLAGVDSCSLVIGPPVDEEAVEEEQEGFKVVATFKNFYLFPLMSYIMDAVDDATASTVFEKAIDIAAQERGRYFNVFQKYSKFDGTIDAKDIQEMCKDMGFPIDDEQAQKAIKELDTKGGGDVDFEEFLKFCALRSTDHDCVALKMIQLRISRGSHPANLMPVFPGERADDACSVNAVVTVCSESTDALKMGVDVLYENPVGSGAGKAQAAKLGKLKGKFKNLTKGIMQAKRLKRESDKSRKQALAEGFAKMKHGAGKKMGKKLKSLESFNVGDNLKALKEREAMEREQEEEAADEDVEDSPDKEINEEGMVAELCLDCGEDTDSILKVLNVDLKKLLKNELGFNFEVMGQKIDFNAKKIGPERVGVRFSGIPSPLSGGEMKDLIEKLDAKLHAGVHLGCSFHEMMKDPDASIIFDLLKGLKIQAGGECANVSTALKALEGFLEQEWGEITDAIPLTGVNVIAHFGFNKDVKVHSLAAFFGALDTLSSFVGIQVFAKGFLRSQRKKHHESWPVGTIKKMIRLFHRITMRIDAIESIVLKDPQLDKPLTVKLTNKGKTPFLRILDIVVVNSYEDLGVGWREFLEEQKAELTNFYLTKIQRFAEELPPLLSAKFPPDCISPSSLPAVKRNLDMFNSPELMIMLGLEQKDPFYKIISSTLSFMEGYLERGLTEWVIEQQKVETQSGADLFEACKEAYDGVHSLIRAGEFEAYDERKKVADSCEWNILPYDDGIDKMPDKAARVVELYRQAKIMKEKWFEELITEVAVKAGGTPHIAPLKGFLRVAEKLAMRPTSGVPWDIVRAQVECEEMQPLSRALALITQNPMVRIHAINDRFARPKAGWCDVSLYFSFDDPECGQVCAEVQLVHYKMMKVREEFGAHDAYNDDRFPMEVQGLQDWRAKQAAKKKS